MTTKIRSTGTSKFLQKTCSRVKFAQSEVSVSWTVNFSFVYFAHSEVSVSWTLNLTTCSWSLPYVPFPGLWQQSNFLTSIKHSCIGRDENEHVKGCCCAGEGVRCYKRALESTTSSPTACLFLCLQPASRAASRPRSCLSAFYLANNVVRLLSVQLINPP